MYVEKSRRNNNSSQQNQSTYIYKKETERKNDIEDSILFRKQDMERKDAEHNMKEKARRSVSKSGVLQRGKEKR